MTKLSFQPLRRLERLLASDQSLFTTQDLAIFWEITDKEVLYSTIQYYLRTGRLHRVYKGIYAIRPYTSFALAQKLLTPSYISFYTALFSHGIIYQFYSTVHSMALSTKKFTIREETFAYHTLKEEIFFNPLGIENKITYLIAGKERAICDSLYLIPGLSFDHLGSLDYDLLRKIANIYSNKRVVTEVEQLITQEEQDA